MEKRGRIELGRTPSSLSGKRSEKFDRDEPVAKGERVKRAYADMPRPPVKKLNIQRNS